MSQVFAVDNVSFAYPGLGPSLSRVSFTVEAGERLALVGANGSGKTTLLHLLDGLYFPQEGTISAFGQPLTEAALDRPPLGPEFRRRVGLLFQNSDAQLFCATVEEELAFAPLQLRWPREEVQRRTADVLELLEISDLRARPPQSLSGEKKRVALASLLVVSPMVLLLDEPTAGLDPRTQATLLEILEQLQQAGITLITATHDLTLLPHLADRALVLGEDHRLAAEGPAEAILEDEALLLSVNLIHAHTHRHGGLVHRHAHQHILAHEHRHEH